MARPSQGDGSLVIDSMVWNVLQQVNTAPLEVRDLRVSYGPTRAVDGVSLEVRPGEIFGLLGPNGAGKTTTLGVLTTRVRPTGGEAWIGPHNVWSEVWRERVAVKRLI